MKTLLLLGIFLLTLAVVAGSATAANTGIVKIDRVFCYYSPTQIYTTPNQRFEIRLVNNTGERVGISNGFKVSSPDGAQWYNVTIDTIYDEMSHISQFAGYFASFGLFQVYPTDNGSPIPDSVGAVGFASPGGLSGLPIDYSGQSLVLTFTCPQDQALNDGKHICIDSATSANAVWKWYGSQGEYVPEFQASSGVYTPGYGYCWTFFRSSCWPPSTTATETPSSCPTCACCISHTGNVNMTGIVDLADLSLLISYLTATVKPTLPCQAEANVNKIGIIDLSDLSFLIAFLTGSPRPELPLCP